MDIDVPKRHLTGEGTGHHRHPSHPEKDDVEARDQGAGGVPTLKISRILIGPTQG